MNMKSFISFFFVAILAIGVKGQIPRFALPASTSPLKSSVRPQTYFDVSGRKSILMGRENGDFEAWVFPMQILKEFRLQYRFESMPSPDDLKHYASHIEVYPERTTLTYTHPLFVVKQHFFAPIDEPGIVILLEVDAYREMEIFASFLPSLQPMWPGGLGGQYAFWDDENKAYILSESRRTFNAMVGAPGAERQSPPLAHELSQKPILFKLKIDPDAARKQYFPIVLTANFESREACIEQYHALQNHVRAQYQKTHNYWKNFLASTLTISGTEFDEAFLWNKVAMHKGFVCNPDLGCGLIAGFGPSGASRRPGFGWFFGGDMFVNSFAMIGFGDFETVKHSIAFLQKYQRDDGKIMHELSQSGGMLNWFEDFPYGYIHGDTTPLYLAATNNYFKHTGDLNFLQESRSSLKKAYEWSRSTDSDGDGLMENTLAGLGASELGSLREASGVDIFLAAIGVEAWRSFAEIAQVLSEDENLVRQANEWFETGKANLENKFWNAEKLHYNFSITRSGAPNAELTAWTAFPMIFDLLPEKRARLTLTEIASSKISTDWGSRMLSNQSAAYDPLAYNNGAVWPFLTGYTIWALYRQGHAEAGLQNLRNLKNWVYEDALGAMPEIVSGEYFRPLETSVPHQLFSNFGFTAGLVRGMLGLRIDTPSRMVTLEPRLPIDLPFLELKNIKVGDQTLSLRIDQSPDGAVLRVLEKPQKPVTINFSPRFGPFASLVRGNNSDVLHRIAGGTFVNAVLKTNDASELKITVDDPLRVWLPYQKPEPGDRSRQMRLCRVDRISDREIKVILEAPGGSEQVLNYRASGKIEVHGAKILDDLRMIAAFEGSGYTRKVLRIKVDF